MNLKFKKSFEKDIEKIKDKKVKAAVEKLIDEVEKADNLYSIKGIKKLQGFSNYYRVRIGNYRLGMEVKGNNVTFYTKP